MLLPLDINTCSGSAGRVIESPLYWTLRNPRLCSRFRGSTTAEIDSFLLHLAMGLFQGCSANGQDDRFVCWVLMIVCGGHEERSRLWWSLKLFGLGEGELKLKGTSLIDP